MAKKKLGYIQLHWECPNCGTINPGGEKVCKGCSAPQPQDVEFFQPTEQQLLEDAEKIKRAKAGADIHCAYCGTRNPAGATHCSQCKADLSEGEKRKSGQVVGAFKAGEGKKIACPHCGAENLETDARCKQCGGSLTREKPTPKAQPQPGGKKRGGIAVLAIIGVVFLGICAAIYFLFLRTSSLSGTVTGVNWERTVILEQVIPVEHQDWQDQVPADGEIVSCSDAERGRSEEYVAGAEEICGTPYSLDTGGGYAEVVQDCEYIIYDAYCTYTLMEWSGVDTLVTSGSDLAAFWPEPSLAQDQRLGEGAESYTIIFEAGGKSYTYQTEDYDLFRQAQPGSKWELEVNNVGGVQSVRP